MADKALVDRYLEFSWGESVPDPVKREKFRYNYSRFFPESPDAAILEVGPGRGEGISVLLEKGYRGVEAVDISKEVVEACRSLIDSVALIDDLVAFLEGRGGWYDMVLMLDVLEHIPKEDTIPTLSALRRSLKTGGRLLLQVPNMSAVFPALHHFSCLTHQVGFSEHSMAQALRSAGFRDFRFFGFEEIVGGGIRMRRNRLLRDLMYRLVRLLRRLDGGLNPGILNPVFFVVATNRPPEGAP